MQGYTVVAGAVRRRLPWPTGGPGALAPGGKDWLGNRWTEGAMAEPWITVIATDVQVGDRIRLAAGTELLVSRIEPRLFGLDLVAFIEDTPERWFKQAMAPSTEVEVLRAG
jgi:hypothetical protein